MWTPLRARIAAVQSRVAAPTMADPRPPPPVPAFSPFRDGHYWCSKCPRRGFTTIPGLSIRALPSNTVLHVPASCRLRMISVVAQCWNGMAQGRDDYAQLEEGRSKLLLSSVPQGLSAATEILKRLTLWE